MWFLPVPEISGSSVTLPYPYSEFTNPTEHTLVILRRQNHSAPGGVFGTIRYDDFVFFICTLVFYYTWFWLKVTRYTYVWHFPLVVRSTWQANTRRVYRPHHCAFLRFTNVVSAVAGTGRRALVWQAGSTIVPARVIWRLTYIAGIFSFWIQTQKWNVRSCGKVPVRLRNNNKWNLSCYSPRVQAVLFGF